MEEDVEIELLFKLNEKLLLEAAKETNSVINKETDHPEKHASSSVEDTKSPCESMTENMIHDHEETSNQLAETSGDQGLPVRIFESHTQILGNQDVNCSNIDHFSQRQNHVLSPLNEECLQGDKEGVDDQLNLHMLDLMATDPVKYYLSQQTSYIEQFEEDEEDEDVGSDDDWYDDFGYQDDDFIDDMLEEPQFQSLIKSPFSGNKTLQKLEIKALPPLTNLAKLLQKRKRYLIALENKLKQLSQENQCRQKDLQDALVNGQNCKAMKSSSQRCCFRKFGMPYFSDDKGFCAPPNMDHQLKSEKKELMIELMPKVNSWTKTHKEMMRNAIKKTLITEKSAILANEITKLTRILEEKVKTKKFKVNSILVKITENQNKLRSLYKKSFKELVKGENENREYDWMKFSVSLFYGLHTPEDCKRFWNVYLKPSINKDSWSDSEDLRLLEIAAQLNFQDWDKIAELLGTNRSGFQCFVHYIARLEGKNDFSSGKWSQVEDKKLMTVINSSKVGDFIPWTKVSSYMSNRNHHQIYSRWVNCLNPELVKGRFSREEDILIVAGVELLGVTFKELALYMNNRTSAQIRERYERHLLPKTAKVGTWSLEEDENLLKLVQNYGAHNWSKIAKEMKTRTRTQVRQRYGFIQKMRKKNPGWTVAQVKRRNINVSKNADKTLKNVANIKKIINKVEQVFNLSDLEKETFLLRKLAELRNKISFQSSSKRGRRRKRIELSSRVNGALLDLFTICSNSSLTKTAKPIHNDTESRLNELFLLANFLGHKLTLPISEEKIWNSPRLNLDLKYFLSSVLNTNSVEQQLSTQLSKQQFCSNIQSSSTDRIDCPISDQDDTIIMMDWWHTPTVNVASLNFSEIFKRTVFDYSNGLHKDIWDSKVKRSQVVRNDHGHSVDREKEHHTTQNYNFPPNQFTSLCKRSILLSRAILARWRNNMDFVTRVPYNYFKKEVIEDMDGNLDINLSYQLEDNLQTLLTWPKVLSLNNPGTVPLYNVHCYKQRQGGLQENLNSNNETSLNLSKSSIQNKQTERNELTVNDTTYSRKIEAKDVAKRRKSHKQSSSEPIRKRKLKNQKSSSTVCEKE